MTQPGDLSKTLPTRMNLSLLAAQLKKTLAGLALLRTRADALSAHRALLQSSIKTKKNSLPKISSSAAISLAKLRFLAPDMHNITELHSQDPLRITPAYEYVAGIPVPLFTCETHSKNTPKIKTVTAPIELVKTATSLYTTLVESVVSLAAEIAAHDTIMAVLSATNRRANALEHIKAPALSAATARIAEVLEEQEREDLFRIKLVQKKKKQQPSKAQKSLAAPDEDQDTDIIF
ncbi:MAG: V-type proton ATPase V1 subunit D, ATP6M [Amphiamblys sp. WSBS2006]|nr:MAG: V-type proton ATPase V1 subunit D, ATP6M [Amphiamblys sp. WSBS2006]